MTIPGRKAAQQLANQIHEPVTLWRRGNRFFVQPSHVLLTSAEKLEEVNPSGGQTVHYATFPVAEAERR